jgi:hypothetical protein
VINPTSQPIFDFILILEIGALSSAGVIVYNNDAITTTQPIRVGIENSIDIDNL